MVDEDFSFADFMRERHAELPLFLIALMPQPEYPAERYASPEGRELLRQHFLYWWRLEEAGQLIGAGPVEVGTPDQTGLAIIRAESREAAEQLAMAEPLHRAGWRVNRVSSWLLNEGLLVPMVRSLPPAVGEG